MKIPEQVAYCSCGPDEYRPCNGEFYHCEGCGLQSEEPMPLAEQMTTEGSWFYYCETCGADWMADGATVVRIETVA